MDDNVMLRCKHCGAPFDVSSLTADATYVTCGSCGTSQTRVDAKNYLEQMMGQVKSWISKAIPMGVNISNADNIDAVARHNIFSNSVRPAIETEMTEYRFGFLSLLSNQLIMMPHRTTSFKPAHQSANAFEFNAKSKSVAALAVDADGLDLMQNADKMSLAYAMMINNMKQLAEDKPGRFTLMSNNFTEAADSLKGLNRYDVVRQRLEALSQVAKGIAFLEEGNAIEARAGIEAGYTALEAAKQATMVNMDFGSTYLAVDQEMSVTKIIMDITETVLTDPSINALQILDILKRVMDVASVVYKSNAPDAGMFKNVLRYNEIFANISRLFASKAGKEGVPITSGAGSVLIPFWSVDLRYSFTTGMLTKKSVEVNEPLLVPASFVTDPASLNNPRQSVTDIFASRPGGFFDSLKGSETSMSESGGIKTMVQSVAENSVGTRKVVVPVSTKNEAEAFVLRYLRQCTSDDKKLKLIKPTVDKLIYVPCEITDSGVSFPTLGKVSPRSVGRMDLLKNLLI
jgi:hypothetical protein